MGNFILLLCVINYLCKNTNNASINQLLIDQSSYSKFFYESFTSHTYIQYIICTTYIVNISKDKLYVSNKLRLRIKSVLLINIRYGSSGSILKMLWCVPRTLRSVKCQSIKFMWINVNYNRHLLY